MTITISLNIQLDATDPATLDAQLAAIARNLFTRSPTNCTTVTSSPRTMPPAPTKPLGRPPKRPAIVEPTTEPNGPESHRTPVLVAEATAEPVTPQIAPIPPATEARDEGGRRKDEGKPTKQPRSGDRLPFAEFDTLVSKELKRLSVDGCIPGAKLWDEQRDKRLPTYTAVMYRYDCTNLASFAEKMGMQPPRSHAFTINHNGANAIYSKESEVVP